MKTIFTLFVVLVLFTLLSATTHAGVMYTVTDLGTLGGNSSIAFGINNNGVVVGRAKNPSGFNHAFYWMNGSMTDINSLGNTSAATAINLSGNIAGYSEVGDGYSHAFLHTNGIMQDLGTLGGHESYAYGINNSGSVVGLAHYENATSNYHAFIFQNGVMYDLGTLGGTNSEAAAINNSGQVAGSADNAMGFRRAFLYSGVSITDLGTLGGNRSRGIALNDSGNVAGFAQLANGNYHAFYYAGGAMTDLGTLGNSAQSYAYGINNLGQIVGTADNELAFIHENGMIHDLNSMINPASGWALREAYGINDLGQIVGWGVNSAGQEHAFLLNPIPGPSSLSLLALLTLAIFRRRR